MRTLLMLVAVVAVVAAACGGGSAEPTPDTATEDVEGPPAEIGSVVVLGDSIMAWNEDAGRAIPDVIADELGVPVTNAAVGGAVAGDVPAQYAETDGTADWIVLDGGGNDLNDFCGCGECSSVADSIVSADAESGVLADFTERLVAAGKNVALVGYYDIPADAAFGFAECGDVFAVHETRLRQLAARFDTVIFIDPSDVVSGSDTDAFDDDLVHPSLEGSRIVGQQIADAIAGGV